MKVEAITYSESDFLNDVLRIARNEGYTIETLHRTNVPQIDFGHKKLHGNHIRALFPVVLEHDANINGLIERIAPGRPCSHVPFRKIIEQIHFERPRAYEEALRGLKNKENQ